VKKKIQRGGRMRLIDVVDYSTPVYLVPLGDVHLGAFNVDFQKFEGYVKWIKENNAYTVLMGDLFDVATLDSETSPFEQSMSLNEAMRYLKNILYPVKDKILCAIEGNHELRLRKKAGFSVTESFCDQLGITYAKFSAVLRFRIGRKRRSFPEMTSPRIEYMLFCHHSTGGGRTIGGRLNRAEQLKFIFEGADAYIIGHNHAKALGEEDVFRVVKSGNGKAKVVNCRVYYIDSGSFLIYEGSYAEASMLRPTNTGAVRIRMNGVRKDLHVSY